MTTLNVLATIPIESATFGVILYDNITNIKTRLNNTQLDGFDILILDDNNNPVNFNNVPWCISLLITMTKERQIHPYDKKNFFDFVASNAPKTPTDEIPTDEPPIDEIPTDEPEPEQIDDSNSLDLLLYDNKLDPITGLLKP